ncbi:MAG TPA: hypothetical protein VLT82_23995 [Myxococcaceae bacterium]|nr:hypothetical protein [Myxococcaceae bacterium]
MRLRSVRIPQSGLAARRRSLHFFLAAAVSLYAGIGLAAFVVLQALWVDLLWRDRADEPWHFPDLPGALELVTISRWGGDSSLTFRIRTRNDRALDFLGLRYTQVRGLSSHRLTPDEFEALRQHLSAPRPPSVTWAQAEATQRGRQDCPIFAIDTYRWVSAGKCPAGWDFDRTYHVACGRDEGAVTGWFARFTTLTHTTEDIGRAEEVEEQRRAERVRVTTAFRTVLRRALGKHE